MVGENHYYFNAKTLGKQHWVASLKLLFDKKNYFVKLIFTFILR